jgi:phage tail protein X
LPVEHEANIDPVISVFMQAAHSEQEAVAGSSCAFSCDKSKNFVANQRYSQRVIRDLHSSSPEIPIDQAIKKCEGMCTGSCTGFFYQKHRNGHQICGFYSSPINGARQAHGHAEGAICEKNSGEEEAAATTDEVQEQAAEEVEAATSEEVQEQAAEEVGTSRLMVRGQVEASTCNKQWGNNYFGINKAFYQANKGLFKVGQPIMAGGKQYYIDAMQIHGNCNSNVALVYVANKRECADGSAFARTTECGYGGKLTSTLPAGADWHQMLNSGEEEAAATTDEVQEQAALLQP